MDRGAGPGTLAWTPTRSLTRAAQSHDDKATLLNPDDPELGPRAQTLPPVWFGARLSVLVKTRLDGRAGSPRTAGRVDDNTEAQDIMAQIKDKCARVPLWRRQGDRTPC